MFYEFTVTTRARLHRSREFLATAGLVSVAAVAQTSLSLMVLLHNPRAWGLLAAGMVCFGAGLATSYVKARERRVTESA